VTRSRWLPLVLVALAWAGPARAVELWASDDGDHLWQLGGFVKAQTLGMDLRGVDLLTTATGAERAGEHVDRLRLESDLFWGDAQIGVAGELAFRVQSAGMSGAGGMPGLSLTQPARPRLWDAGSWSSEGLVLAPSLDRAFVKLPLGPLDLTVGRQAITWGSAWFWKPTDRFSPFSPLDVDPDVKRGVDALRAEIYFTSMTSLDLVASVERHPGSDRPLWAHGGARLRTTLGRYDLAVSVARFQQRDQGDWMLGLEFTGELGDVGFRGEAAGNLYEDGQTWDVEAVLGAVYHVPAWWVLGGTTFAMEIFYNGYGADDAAAYLGYFVDPADPLGGTPAKGERLVRGEAFFVGRYYAGLSLDQELYPLLHLTLATIGNLGDPSLLITAGLRWDLTQDARVTLGSLIPVGRAPEGLTLRSEFGLMPLVAYAVIKLSF